MADDFFANFSGHFASEEEPEETALEHAVHEVEGAVRDAEEKLEVAAGSNFLGGPMVWGFIALAVLVLLVLVFNQ